MANTKLSFNRIVAISLGGIVTFILVAIIAVKVYKSNKNVPILTQAQMHNAHTQENSAEKQEIVNQTKDIVAAQLSIRDGELKQADEENKILKNQINKVISVTDNNNKILMSKITGLESRVNDIEHQLLLTVSKSKQINIIHLDNPTGYPNSQLHNSTSVLPINNLKIISFVGDRAWITENGIEKSITKGDTIQVYRGRKMRVVKIDSENKKILAE
jgi:hypothetical protein